jgi:two-component system, NarL family, sensor histidine kinase UhpB
MIRTLLQVPLSAKLLLANGALLAAAAGVGAWMGRAGSPTGEPAALAVLSVIVLGMFGINWILVRIALAPVKRLEEAAVRVSGGDPDVQVPASPVADRSLQRLTRTFNEMVHSLGRLHRERDRLSQDLLAAGEQERKSLAQELLSGPAQTLSTTLLLLRRNGSGDGDGAQAAESVRGALEELRRISAALHPPELNELGLATALRALTRSRLESREIQTQVKVEGTEKGVPEEIRLGAFRLIQEAVEIAARIPRLDRVSLWLRKDGPSLLIHVSLAGLPPNLSPEALPEERESGLGSGLHRMVERARLMGGDVRIQGGPGPELAILVRLPVTEAPASSELPRSGSAS